MKRKNSSAGIVVLVVLILIVAAMAYLYNSKMFEREAPSIELKSNIEWNLKKPIPVKISDASGIKFIRATLSDGKNSIVLVEKLFTAPTNEYTLNITFPRTGFITNKKKFSLEIEAVDTSKWNFFAGNQAMKKSIINVDTKRPALFIINNSYKIIQGGVGTVIFKVKDDNLKELYIQTNFGKRFYATPFYKDDHFISLLAWPSNEKNFKATIIAKDKAGNVAKSRVRFYLKGKKYRISKIKLNDRFLDGKITDIAEDENMQSTTMSKLEKFKYVNEDLRDANEALISKITSKVPTERVDSISLKPFYPLRNGQAVASFGDHRFFSYEGEEVSESYHLGLDLASTANASVVVSNAGTIVFAKYNGIYGKNIIISHGLGIYSLYGHNSNFLFDEGDNVNAGDVISKTGMTGLALGDHLHFGILVQGVEVRPEEWMDKKWMRESVFGVIKSAKKIIDRK